MPNSDGFCGHCGGYLREPGHPEIPCSVCQPPDADTSPSDAPAHMAPELVTEDGKVKSEVEQGGDSHDQEQNQDETSPDHEG